jgi:hypothetical protein
MVYTYTEHRDIMGHIYHIHGIFLNQYLISQPLVISQSSALAMGPMSDSSLQSSPSPRGQNVLRAECGDRFCASCVQGPEMRPKMGRMRQRYGLSS